MTFDVPVLAAVLLSFLAGASIAGLIFHNRNLERRLKALEDSIRPVQKRWSHSQLEDIERLKFLLGRHIAERKVADEFLRQLYREMGDFYETGPNGK